MSIKDGWFDWAKREPGHPVKVYPGRNDAKGIVWHSAEGYLATLIRQAGDFRSGNSWTGSIAFDGTLYQHYPVEARCWASGNYVANSRYWSFELEGTAGNRISAEQIQTCLRIAREFEAYSGMKATRTMAGPRTMWEHNEVAQIATPNAGPTSCPSHRYDPFFAALDAPTSGQQTEEDDMTEEQVRAIVAEMVFGSKARYDELHDPSGTIRAQPLEARVDRIETKHLNDIDRRLTALEQREPGGVGNGAKVRITGIIEEES